MKALRWLDANLEKIMVCIILVLISVFMFAQILMRNLLNYSIPWADEACRYLFVWSGGVGISYATKNNSHLRMDIVPHLFPKLDKPLTILADLALVAVAIILIRGSLPLFTMLNKTNQLSAAMRLPMKFVYSSMFVGFGLSIVRIMQRYILMYMKPKAQADKGGGQVCL